jgi:nicotinate phosphoribosyltransferase
MMTALALNAFSYPIRSLTKLTRLKLACGKKLFGSGGSVRSWGMEQVPIHLDANYIAGTYATIQPLFFKRHPELIGGKKGAIANINHAVIKSFKNEEAAFNFVIGSLLPELSMAFIMVDTYNARTGLKRLIERAKKLPKEQHEKIWVCIDSGDMYEEAEIMRRELDRHGLKNVRIASYGNLQEYKILDLEKRKSKIDYYIPMTEAVNITDAPKLEAVFKMSEIRKPDGSVEYKAKLTKGKSSYPGKKQIFRVFDSKGLMKKDIIGREEEKLGEPMLKHFIGAGKTIRESGKIEETKKTTQENLERLPAYAKEVYCKKDYPIEVSAELKKLLKSVEKEHLTQK